VRSLYPRPRRSRFGLADSLNYGPISLSDRVIRFVISRSGVQIASMAPISSPPNNGTLDFPPKSLSFIYLVGSYYPVSTFISPKNCVDNPRPIMSVTSTGMVTGRGLNFNPQGGTMAKTGADYPVNTKNVDRVRWFEPIWSRKHPGRWAVEDLLRSKLVADNLDYTTARRHCRVIEEAHCEMICARYNERNREQEASCA